MPAVEFRAARDFLLAHRDDDATAYEKFRWPVLTGFNWALDWFDEGAENNDSPALWSAAEDGSEGRYSFAEMSRRPAQPADLRRRDGVRRRGARHVVVRSAGAGEVEGGGGEGAGLAGGGPVDGGVHSADADGEPETFTPYGSTMAQDTFLLYFTSGTTAQPKLVEHTHATYPAGHLSTMYWIGLRPGDVHLNISSPGWAKHAWSNIFAPWNAEACVFIFNYTRFDPDRLLDTLERCGVTSFCAPPTVWRMLIQADLGRLSTPPREVVAAGEPLNPEVIERVRDAWGLTIRDGFGQTE